MTDASREMPRGQGLPTGLLVDTLGSMASSMKHSFAEGSFAGEVSRPTRDAMWLVHISHPRVGRRAVELRVDSDITELLKIRAQLPLRDRQRMDLVMWVSFGREAWNGLAASQMSSRPERLYRHSEELWQLIRWAPRRTAVWLGITRDSALRAHAAKRFGWARAGIVVTAVLGIFFAGVLVWLSLTSWNDKTLAPGERYNSTVSAISAAAQFLGGAAVVLALFLTQRQTRLQARAIEESTRLAEQGQITDRIDRSIKMLSDTRHSIVLGGLLALSRIARESARDHTLIIRILIAELRSRSVAIARDPQDLEVRAELLVAIGARFEGIEGERAHREPTTIVRLSGLRMDGVIALGVDFSGSFLDNISFAGAVLRGAKLNGATLNCVDLRGADLRGAQFGAFEVVRDGSSQRISSAGFTLVDLRGANLFYAKGVTKALMEAARISTTTHAPTNPPPSWWSNLNFEADEPS